MNVLFLNSIDQSTYGGMEEWVRLVASGLRERGHSIAIAGRKDSEFLRRLSLSDRRLEMLPLNISGDFNPATIATIHKAIIERHIDTVIVNFNKDLRLGGLAAKWSGEARVIWSMGLDITRDSVVHRWLTPKLADAILVPSVSLKSQITRHGYLDAGVVEVIPIGIPDTAVLAGNVEVRTRIRAKYGIAEDAVVAVTSGRFVEQKGHRYLLEATSELTAKFSELHFLWLGSGPLENELRIRVGELGLSSRVIFAGMLDSVDEHLAASDLVVHPSIEEPFGIAILEGMRARLPIVASKVGGIPEVVDDRFARLVSPRDSGALVEAIKILAGNGELRREMGLKARERYLSEFSVEKMYDRVEGFLTGVARGERRAG